MKALVLQVKKSEYIRTYLTVLNGILKLTETELDLLIVFLQVNHKDPCTIDFKEEVLKRTKLKNVAVLNNYIKKFKTKGILLYNNGIYSYNPVLDPEKYIEGVTVRFQYT